MLVVLMGVCGSGKTSVGQRLGELLGWKFGEGDEYHPPENVEKMRLGKCVHMPALGSRSTACLARFVSWGPSRAVAYR